MLYNRLMSTNRYLPYIICIGGALLAGIIGSIGTIDAIPTWYASLNQPSWTPPNWLFGPVWTTLYILMGVAAALVWKSDIKEGKSRVITFFFLHLLVNTAWSLVFFSLKNVEAALAVITVLWFMIATLMVLFWKYDKRSTYLLVPYILWVSYASTLNLGILLLNP